MIIPNIPIQFSWNRHANHVYAKTTDEEGNQVPVDTIPSEVFHTHLLLDVCYTRKHSHLMARLKDAVLDIMSEAEKHEDETKDGAPGGIRTPDSGVRSAEL